VTFGVAGGVSTTLWRVVVRASGLVGHIGTAGLGLLLAIGLVALGPKGPHNRVRGTWPPAMTADALRTEVAAVLPRATLVPEDTVRGEVVVVVEREAAAQTLRTLRDHPTLAFDILSDLPPVHPLP